MAVLVGFQIYRDTEDAVGQAKSSLRILATPLK